LLTVARQFSCSAMLVSLRVSMAGMSIPRLGQHVAGSSRQTQHTSKQPGESQHIHGILLTKTPHGLHRAAFVALALNLSARCTL
jgi:hypothetical protein